MAGNFWQSGLGLATPLLWVALGETLMERAGLLNIGTEGTMLVGAFAAAWATWATGNLFVGIVAGALAGALFGTLYALLCVRGRGDQVIVGAGLNLLALGITGALFRILQKQTGAFTVPLLSPLPPFGQHALTYGAWLLTLLMAWWLWRTQAGLVVRALGEDPVTVQELGYPVRWLRSLVALVGSLLMGVGGAALTLGETGSFNEGVTAGQGFIALCMVILGRWHPFWVGVGCLAFGLLRAFALQLQVLWVGVPYQIVLALPYAVTLLLLAMTGRRTRSPSALAQPF
jgi:simple sugar transport system permease protein